MKFFKKPGLPKKIIKNPVAVNLSKRGQFVVCVLLLSVGMFTSEFASINLLLLLGVILAAFTVLFLYLVLRKDLKGSSYFPIFILPFFYTLSFSLFYSLIPSRLVSRLLLTAVYSFGLYSLFLTENIYVISSIRTINLLRSARIVSFVITIFILFFLFNFVFSLRLPFFVTPIIIGILSFLMCFQSLWTYTESRDIRIVTIFSSYISFMLAELALVLSMWPVSAAIYAIFLTGIFYTYSGLSHAWMERRLFKGILWEYMWVGFLSILFMVVFSKWGS